MYKVTKKIFSLLLVLFLCLSTSQLAQAAETSPVSNVIPETETTVPPAPVTDGELHGLILMTQNQNRIAENMNTVVKIYTINPITGIQTQISEFKKLYPAMDLCTITTGVRGYFNYDYTKMATNIMNPDYNSYRNVSGFNHAGWIDQGGNFFDVSAALGITNNSPIGFYESDFYFTGVQTMVTPAGKHYVRGMICKATESEIRQGRFNIVSTGSEFDIVEPYIRYIVSKDILGGVRVTGKWGHLMAKQCKLGENCQSLVMPSLVKTSSLWITYQSITNIYQLSIILA